MWKSFIGTGFVRFSQGSHRSLFFCWFNSWVAFQQFVASRCPNIDLWVVVDLDSLRCARPNSVLISWGNDPLFDYVILISIGWVTDCFWFRCYNRLFEWTKSLEDAIVPWSQGMLAWKVLAWIQTGFLKRKCFPNPLPMFKGYVSCRDYLFLLFTKNNHHSGHWKYTDI